MPIKLHRDSQSPFLKATLGTKAGDIKPLKCNTAIIGKKENRNMESINKMGEFTEVTLEEIFGD